MRLEKQMKEMKLYYDKKLIEMEKRFHEMINDKPRNKIEEFEKIINGAEFYIRGPRRFFILHKNSKDGKLTDWINNNENYKDFRSKIYEQSIKLGCKVLEDIYTKKKLDKKNLIFQTKENGFYHKPMPNKIFKMLRLVKNEKNN